MDKQKKQAIQQMVFAAILCAAVVIPGMLAVNAATVKEQTEQAEQAKQEQQAVAEKIEAIKAVVEEVPEEQPEPLKYWQSIPLDAELQNYIVETCEEYGIQPEIVMAVIERESRFKADAMGDNGQAYGLMQIHPRWHYQRMVKLDCTDLLAPYHNVTVGIDYLAELYGKYGDMGQALTAYNQGSYKGTITEYAKSVMTAAERLGEADVLHG